MALQLDWSLSIMKNLLFEKCITNPAKKVPFIYHKMQSLLFLTLVVQIIFKVKHAKSIVHSYRVYVTNAFVLVLILRMRIMFCSVVAFLIFIFHAAVK